MALLRRDIPSLKLWSHTLGNMIYMSLDRHAQDVVNRSARFRAMYNSISLISISLSSYGDGLWRLSHTDPIAEVVAVTPDNLDAAARVLLAQLVLVLRGLGLQVDDVFFANTCGARQLGSEQRRLAEVFHIGKWLMLDAESQMRVMGFPTSENPDKLCTACDKLRLLGDLAIPVNQKRAFFTQLMTHGFNNLRGPPTG